MFTWLKNNIGTIIVLLILSSVVALIFRSILSDRKKGRHLCGGNCSGCSCCSLCNSKNKSTSKKK